VFDTVLWNEEGEITESTFGNIAMLLDGRWVTPPLACGLLPGVGRAVALREAVCEAVVRLQDLPRVQGWAFINSLRGWLANCRIPDDCIDSKRYPLFMARAVLKELIESLQSTQGVKPC
jgi:para-aminobenzoate synthetase/4-amino-4-deoxychorismate lyase